jgi:hypothetical protein
MTRLAHCDSHRDRKLWRLNPFELFDHTGSIDAFETLDGWKSQATRFFGWTGSFGIK